VFYSVIAKNAQMILPCEQDVLFIGVLALPVASFNEEFSIVTKM
jgi:hypothetical protein